MQITTVGNYALTVGWLIALVVFIVALLAEFGVVPFSAQVVFGLIGALAIARLT